MKAIVFDLFHTLIDPEDYRPKDFRRSEFIAEIAGIEPDPFWKWWMDDIYARLTGITNLTDEVVAYAAGQGVSVEREVIDEAILASAGFQRMAMSTPRTEVMAALEKLKSSGVHLGLLSNAEEWEMRTFSSSPLYQVLDGVTVSYETGFAKPDLEAYVDIVRKLEVDPQDSAYVANGWDDELEGARNAGFKLVVFMRGFVGVNGLSNPEELERLEMEADETIDDIGELAELI